MTNTEWDVLAQYVDNGIENEWIRRGNVVQHSEDGLVATWTLRDNLVADFRDAPEDMQAEFYRSDRLSFAYVTDVLLVLDVDDDDDWNADDVVFMIDGVMYFGQEKM